MKKEWEYVLFTQKEFQEYRPLLEELIYFSTIKGAVQWDDVWRKFMSSCDLDKHTCAEMVVAMMEIMGE